MKFTKFGKALLMGALSTGVVLSITSCVQSYSVGYLYTTGTVTAETSNNGIISGYKIDHNTGKLTLVNGLPIASGGSNPVRAVLLTGSRFLYVLNRGVNAAGNGDCTSAQPCTGANITQFAVGGNGILTAQETFYTEGLNPFRIFADSQGAHLYVLDHDAPADISTAGAPVSSTTSPSSACKAALGGVTACGDITAFNINATTGRLTLVVNAQVTSASGSAIPFFPVPVNPVDFIFAGNNILTMSANASTVQSYPYTHGTSVFPFAYNAGNGQLSISQNSSQPVNANEGTHLDYAGGNVYVLDNEPITVDGVVSTSQILPFTMASSGALSAQTNGAVADDPSLSNPSMLIVESKGKWIYVANQGNLTSTSSAASGINGYVINSPFQLTTMPGSPFGSGAGPVCMVEDPSNQFIYTVNAIDSTITGRSIEQNSGDLRDLTGAASTYTLTGPPTWCLVDGRTS
jgi:6-phosphogluconolactonase (cycloisomerase 2 family)